MHNKRAGFVILLLDLVAIIAAFFFSWLIASEISRAITGNDFIEIFSDGGLARVYSYGFLSIALVFAFFNNEHYKSRIPWWEQVQYVAVASLIAMLIDGFMHFAIKEQFSRLWIISSWLSAIIFILIGRLLSRSICLKMSIWNIPTVLIGDRKNIIETIFALYSEKYVGYDIKSIMVYKGFKKFDRDSLPMAYQNIEVIDGNEHENEFIKKHEDSFFILAPGSNEGFNIKNIIKKLNRENDPYVIVPPFEGIQMYGTTPRYFFGYDLMFLLFRSKANAPLSRIAKRLVDILGSLFALILFSPIFVILAIIVKKDGGPAFYSQKRLGKNGKHFSCWKFRSMAVDSQEKLEKLLAEDPEAKKMWDIHHKLKNDPRITKVGNIIRKTSVDELPQLWNVLKGEMSLVGPRPIVDDEIKHYDEKINDYYQVKPGVTGLWQVSGRNDTSYKHRVYLDSWYVQNWSFWGDIIIIFKTVIVLCKREGVY